MDHPLECAVGDDDNGDHDEVEVAPTGDEEPGDERAGDRHQHELRRALAEERAGDVAPGPELAGEGGRHDVGESFVSP